MKGDVTAMLTTKEAAQRLGLKTSAAVRQLILAGRLQAKKQGRDWVIEEDEIERFEKEPRKVGRPKQKIDSHLDTQVTKNAPDADASKAS